MGSNPSWILNVLFFISLHCLFDMNFQWHLGQYRSMVLVISGQKSDITPILYTVAHLFIHLDIINHFIVHFFI